MSETNFDATMRQDETGSYLELVIDPSVLPHLDESQEYEMDWPIRVQLQFGEEVWTWNMLVRAEVPHPDIGPPRVMGWLSPNEDWREEA